MVVVIIVDMVGLTTPLSVSVADVLGPGHRIVDELSAVLAGTACCLEDVIFLLIGFSCLLVFALIFQKNYLVFC